MILVLSTYRTGSTNLCKDLSEANRYENLDECFHEALADKHKDVLSYIIKNPNLTAKEYADLLNVRPNYVKELLKEIEILEIQEKINSISNAKITKDKKADSLVSVNSLENNLHPSNLMKLNSKY